MKSKQTRQKYFSENASSFSFIVNKTVLPNQKYSKKKLV